MTLSYFTQTCYLGVRVLLFVISLRGFTRSLAAVMAWEEKVCTDA